MLLYKATIRANFSLGAETSEEVSDLIQWAVEQALSVAPGVVVGYKVEGKDVHVFFRFPSSGSEFSQPKSTAEKTQVPSSGSEPEISEVGENLKRKCAQISQDSGIDFRLAGLEALEADRDADFEELVSKPAGELPAAAGEEAETAADIPPGFEEITFDSVPTQERWALPALYKKSQTGAFRVWRIHFDGENLRTAYGQIGGAVTRESRAVATNNSGRSLQEQALLEARHRYHIKVKNEGFAAGEPRPPPLFEPMLSHPMGPGHEISHWPVYVQPKLDGVRLLTHFNYDQAGTPRAVVCRSRKNTFYTHLTHITEELVDFFPYLPEGATLDGEAYCHGLTQNIISGLMRTEKEIPKGITQLQYWIFDIVYDYEQNSGTAPVPYEERIEVLSHSFNRYVKDLRENDGPEAYPRYFSVVPTYIAHDMKELEGQFLESLELGYEGVMVKHLARGQTAKTKVAKSYYKSNRNANTLKVKKSQDEEAEVIGVTRGTGREADSAMLTVRDARGNVLDLRPLGSLETRRTWLENPQLVLGKLATIRFQNLSPKGVPLMARVVAIRDYE